MTQTKSKQNEIGLIPEDWAEYRLSDKIELCYGKALIDNNRIFGRIPVYGSNGIIGHHNESLVKGPGIIVGRKGSVGEVIFSKSDFWSIDTTYFIKLKYNENINFWYYFLLTLKLNKMNSHSAVPGLNRDQVYELLKKIPETKEQNAIAKVLSDLDLKIELNQQMNKTLEEIGKTLFKRWFVDFEFPNEHGKPYKLSGGEMVYNDELKKEIPKGWKVDNLGSIVDINWGDMNTTKASYIDLGFPTYSASGLDGQMDHYDYDSKGIILGAIGANCGKTWFANGRWSCIKNTIRIIPKEQQVIEYIYFLSNDNSFWPKRGSAQPFVSQTDARNISIIVPEEKVLSVFIKQSSYLLDKIRQNELENIELVKIRDLLLPKLMSGKIRVKC